MLCLYLFNRLSKEPLKDKLKAFETVGGHPKTIELLDSYTVKRPLNDVLEYPEVKTKLDEELDRYFMGESYSSLTDEERNTLQRLCAFKSGFEIDAVTKTGGSMQVLDRLIKVSLLQLERFEDVVTYRIHPVVREYVFTRLDETEKEKLHIKAAEYFKEKMAIQREQRGAVDIQHILDTHFHLFRARKYEELIYTQGVILQAKKQYWEAYNKYSEALRITEKMDYKLIIASCSYQIGQLSYMTEQSLNKAIKCFCKALDYYRKLKNPNGISRAIRN